MHQRNAVAIVGIGCRLPGGVSTTDELTEFLKRRGDAVTDVPADRWHLGLHYNPDPDSLGKSYVKRAAFLSHDVFAFDPAPFGISPREADHLDPQQRLLLEVSWEAFEDAGVPISRARGSKTGVFIGGFTLDHQTLVYSEANRLLIGPHTSVGASLTMLSNRISYTFDLRGPSLTVDTACSSSLVAVHLAREALLRGECDLALAGGVTVMLSPVTMAAMSKGHFLAPDGRSKTFDARADGYGRGEGAGVVVLKSLAAALRDGDRIYAVIAATGVNQDGRTDGISMPSERAQRELSASVLAASGLDAMDIGYVEAHGTGTRVGDPTEVRALADVYGRRPERTLPIGSIKTNIGHLEAAAGVTGLIKAALSIHHRELYPLRELLTENPDIQFDRLSLRPVVQSEPWPDRRIAAAAVNAFGYGGTNAHAVLYEAPRAGALESGRSPSPRMRLVPLSAASRRALSASAAQHAESLQPTDWLDHAFTLAHHRAHLPERAVVRAATAAELRESLDSLARSSPDSRVVLGRASSELKLLWVYTGMGPQWWAMGRELYRTEATFRKAVEQASDAFHAASGFSIVNHLLRDEDTSQMKSNEIAQPANFVLQVGLTALLRRIGVPQHGFLGHSVGEVAAAWAAGCLSLEQAARLTYYRSRLQQKIAGRGAMLAVGLSADAARALLQGRAGVDIAAYNSPQSVALAGDPEVLRNISAELSANGTFNRMMPVEVAYHSSQMDELHGEMLAAFASLEPSAPNVPLYSTLRGSALHRASHDAEYFWQNARRPVLLESALRAACADGYDAFLEVGPHPVLGAAIREVLRDLGEEPRTFHCLKRGAAEQETLYRNIAELYSQGLTLDWTSTLPRGRPLNLPKYPFQRERHWAESGVARARRLGSAPALGFFTDGGRGPRTRFVADLARSDLAYLYDHQIQGNVVFPGAAYIEAALSALALSEPRAGRPSNDTDRRGPSELVLENIRFERALVLQAAKAPAVALELAPDGAFAIFARHEEQSWERHARGRGVFGARYLDVPNLRLPELRSELTEVLDVASMYESLARIGLEYGPAFRRIEELRVRRSAGGGEILARLDSRGSRNAWIDPTALDAAFHALLAVLGPVRDPMLPVSIEFVRLVASAAQPCWIAGRLQLVRDDELSGELSLADETGRILLSVRGLVCKRLTSASSANAASARWIHADGFQRLPWPSALRRSSRIELLGDPTPWREEIARAADTGSDRSDPVTFVLSVAAEPGDHGGVAACTRALEALQALPSGSTVRIVTSNAFAIEPEDRPDPVQTALWGLGRVLMTERPDLDCRLIDLGSSIPASADALLAVLAQRGEEELAARGDTLYARRLERAGGTGTLRSEPAVLAAEDCPSGFAWAGASDAGPQFSARRRSQPQADQIEVAVRRVSMRASDTPESGPPDELPVRAHVGTAVELGDCVEHIRQGDSVLVLDSQPPASHLTVSAERVLQLAAPAGSDVPTAYGELLIAWYALVQCGGLRAGERVLLLGSGGSFARAAVRVARHLGASIVVTIDAARDPAVLHELGAELVLTNDTLDFARAIARHCESGVQLVLNVQPEPGRSEALGLLQPGGRFVDFDAGPLNLERLPSGVSYTRLDADDLIGRRTAELRELLPAVISAFTPCEVGEPAHDLTRGELPVRVDEPHTWLFRGDRSYLVTGGLTGLGLATAEWLVERGAGCVVLGGRRGPDAAAEAAIERMRRAGASVEVRTLDVTQPESVESCLSFVERSLPALAGIFHSAMVLEDQPFDAVTPESLAKVMAPKACGAHWLYEKTCDDGLDYFVLYGSVSALIGNPNQAAYSAANAFLLGLAQRGAAEGRHVTCVSFGPLADVGVVARDAATQSHLDRLGFAATPARASLDALGWALHQRRAHVGIIDASWDRWMKNFPETPWARLALLAGDDADAEHPAYAALRALFDGLDEQQRTAALVQRVCEVAAEVFRIDPARIDSAAPLKELGLDSLMAVELQSNLDQHLGLLVPTMQLLAGVTATELALRLSELLDGEPQEAPPQPTAAPELRGDDLRAHCLSRICVQPPYFDLTDLALDGDWIAATAELVAPSEDEDDVLSCAEAARHLAIVGSCAVSLRCPLPGRVYYPVHRARHTAMVDRTELGRGEPLRRARVRARCVSLELEYSRATAETELLDARGEVLVRLVVDYHVIPAAEFTRMFAQNAEPTDETLPTPYHQWTSLTVMSNGSGTFSAELGAVDPTKCAGHFVGYPAFPVSIMTRHAIQLTAEAFRRSSGRGGASIRVVEGEAETSAFIFAHEPVSLAVHRVSSDAVDGIETWRCEVFGKSGTAARFHFRIQAAWPRVSGLQVRGSVERTG